MRHPRYSFPFGRRKKKERNPFEDHTVSESALQNQKFATTRKRGKPNLRKRERERVTKGSPLVRVRPPLLVIPVVMETPPRRPRASGHPRTPQTPSSLSRSPRHSPPLFPSTLSLLVSSTPSPLLKPPFARVHQEPVSIRGRVRGPTYSTGSATDNEIVRYHPLAFSPSLFAFLWFSPRFSCVSNWRLFYSIPSDPRFPDFLAAVYLSAPLHSILEIVTRYWILVYFHYLSPFTRDLC